MTIFFVGTAIWDSVYQGSIAPENLINQSLGGAAVTAALACKAAAPKENVVFIGEIGADERGTQFKNRLAEAGIEVAQRSDPNTKTSEAPWIINEKGEKKLITGATHLLEPRVNTADKLADVNFLSDDIIVFCSKTTTNHWPKYRALASRAHEAGAMIAIAPNTRAFIKDNPTPADIENATLDRDQYLEFLAEQMEITSFAMDANADIDALFLGKPIEWDSPMLDVFRLPEFYILTHKTEPTYLYQRLGTETDTNANWFDNPLVEIPVKVIHGVSNIVGTGDMTLGTLVGELAAAGIRHNHLGLGELTSAINKAQESTANKLAERKKFEQSARIKGPEQIFQA